MAITRIKNNQITDSSAGNVYLGINAAVKLQDYSITAGKIANSLVYGSDLTVTGNLTVNGQTTTIDTVSVVIEDPILYLAANQTGSPSLDIGFIGERGTSENITFVWDESAGEFVTGFTNDTTTNSTVTITSYADFHTNNANIGGNIVINGTTSFVGNIISTVNITGNLAAGNISTPGQISAVGNISGGNLNAVANVETANLRVTSMTANRMVFAGEDNYLITTQNFTYDGVTANLQGGSFVIDNFTIDATNITSNANITIGSSGNANIDITPAGTGVVNIDNITIADNTIGSSTGNIVLDPTANIVLPDETASAVLYLTAQKEIESSSNFVYDGTTANIQGALVVDNVRVDGNEISTTDTDGNLTLNPNGNGFVIVDAFNTNFTGNIETTGNALIGGNLVVQGNITYINIDDLRVEDPIIILGTGPNGNALVTNDGKDRGIFMEYYTTGLGNAFMGWDNSSGNMVIANDAYFTGNDVVGINAYGTLEVGNIYGQSAVFVGNVDAGNLNSAGAVIGNVQITGNLGLGNLSVTGVINTTGNITGGNLISNAAISAATTIDATGNITGGNLTTTGLTSTATLNASGNANVGNLGTAGLIVATGNITGGNINTGAQVVATGNVTGGNINTGGQVVATGNITGNNVIGTTSGQFGNIVISGDDITDTNGRVNFNTAGADVDFAVNGDTVANVFYVDAGTGTASFGSATQTTGAGVAFNYTNSLLLPSGNSAQRPTGVTGMVRFNTTLDSLEFYDADSWVSAGTVFTVIDSEVFNGDGSTVAFTLATDQTTDSCIVSINGVLQIPVLAYSVSGNVLTFTEAPLSQDTIEVREITTTVTVKAISNSVGNAVIEVEDTSSNVYVTGNLVPVANNAQDLGSATLRWKDGYFSGNSITLGNIVLKNTSGNTLSFFGPDGTTPGVLSSNNVDTTSIANGNASVQTLSASGNVVMTSGGVAQLTTYPGGVVISGNLLVEGTETVINVVNLNVEDPILALGRGANNTPLTSDDDLDRGVEMYYYVTGVGEKAAFMGWEDAANTMIIAQDVTIANNVVSINNYGSLRVGSLLTSGILNTNANGVGNIGNSSTYFDTAFIKATSAQYADLAENYEADADYEPGTVLCFGGAKEVTVCNTVDCTRVAGVVSTNPSYLMNSGQTGDNVAAVALQGRVPTKVTGQIRKGDLIVSAGDGRGRANNDARAGTIIGKALADFDGQDGVIEVVVGRV